MPQVIYPETSEVLYKNNIICFHKIPNDLDETKDVSYACWGKKRLSCLVLFNLTVYG